MRSCLLCIPFILISSIAQAATIKITDPNPTYFAQANNCPPAYPQCYDNGYLQTSVINSSNAGIQHAFDAWNQTFGGNMWSIVPGGFLDAEFDVSLFQTQIEPTKDLAGVEIRIFFNYTGADRNQFSWAQEFT